MDLLFNYLLFLAKSLTLVVAVIVVITTVISLSARARRHESGEIEVRNLNEELKQMQLILKDAVLDRFALKRDIKEEKKANKLKDKELKEKEKQSESESVEPNHRRRVYVLEFEGDMQASAVEHLRQEVTTVLTLAEASDEVVVKIDSPGGVVHGYGLAASQLDRIRKKNVPLTICVDQVAASGGYMMACVGNRILAAPFAIIGSIGVVAQMPNFHRLLRKNEIDVELHTAGEYKRTLTLFGENTDAGRRKFVQELEEVHGLFKAHVQQSRPQLEIDKVATGEHWYGKQALELGLVDEIITSDEYLEAATNDADVYLVKYIRHRTVAERLGMTAEGVLDRVALRWWGRLTARTHV